MSGFDENPFEPPVVDNPFEDPSVKQVTNQTSSVQRDLEEYNPWGEDGGQKPSLAARGASHPPALGQQGQPAVVQPSQESRAQPTTNTMTASDFQRRQEELERKAAELQRREEELRNTTYNVRRNNWPPLPENCCGLEPCFYQDINIEIPVDFQSVVRQLYYLWIYHTLLMVANVVGSLALLIGYGEFSTFGLSILYTLLATPFSFLCWYRPGYKAFRNDSSFNFMVFFFIFFFQFVITVVQAIGLPSAGTCGLLTAVKIFEKSVKGILIGLMTLSIALGFCAAAAFDLLLLSKVHRIYRSSGASMAKAQAEFTSEFLRNEHVREAASSAASAAVQSQFQQSRGSSRY